LGAEKLVKEGNCMWKDTAATAPELKMDSEGRYFKTHVGKRCKPVGAQNHPVDKGN